MNRLEDKMKLLTEEAHLACKHELGRVKNKPSQDWVTIEGKRILVDNDPEGCNISGCPNTNPLIGILPCRHTLKVTKGYSEWIRIDGHAISLDTVTGLTDGTPPGVVLYTVKTPGQEFVTEVG